MALQYFLVVLPLVSTFGKGLFDCWPDSIIPFLIQGFTKIGGAVVCLPHLD